VSSKNTRAKRISRIFLLACLRLLPAVFLPAGSEAQQAKKMPRIGYLGSGRSGTPQDKAFIQGLRDLGYIEGQNIAIEYRSSGETADRFSDLLADLITLKVDVIVSGNALALQTAKKATATIPIVMAHSADPMALGLINSLARPGGNVTGLTYLATELNGKRLELFKETIPHISRAAVLFIPTGSGPAQRQELEGPAKALGIQIRPVEVPRAGDFETAFSAVAKERPHGLFIIRTFFMGTNALRINNFAEKSKLPTMWDQRIYAEPNGLMSYGADSVDMYRRAATYVNKILKGAKPADLPVERPVKFDLVINLKTAKQIGLTVPPNVLARADRVIR
jgi:putative ABC transport system substrate-binding protein